jgi:hypothetical protein
VCDLLGPKAHNEAGTTGGLEPWQRCRGCGTVIIRGDTFSSSPHSYSVRSRPHRDKGLRVLFLQSTLRRAGDESWL